MQESVCQLPQCMGAAFHTPIDVKMDQQMLITWETLGHSLKLLRVEAASPAAL